MARSLFFAGFLLITCIFILLLIFLNNCLIGYGILFAVGCRFFFFNFFQYFFSEFFLYIN